MPRCLRLLPLILLPLGCAEPLPPADPTPDPPPAALASRFDAATAGTLRGRVTWDGDLPNVPPFEAPGFVPEGERGQPRLLRPNPHAPAIDPASRGVANAVVYLKGVDPTRARPWHLAAVSLEQRDRMLFVVQGPVTSTVGFVRRGNEVELVSREPRFHALHLSGAAFFTLTFPDPDQPLRRALTKTGHSECASAAGYFWMRGHLFVDDHPYYARTDAHGDFVLEQVPPGTYEVVCWHPNWRELGRDRDPETALVLRLRFRLAVTQTQGVTIPAAGAATVAFTLRPELFEAKK